MDCSPTPFPSSGHVDTLAPCFPSRVRRGLHVPPAGLRRTSVRSSRLDGGKLASPASVVSTATVGTGILIDGIHANDLSTVGLGPEVYEYHATTGYRTAFEYLPRGACVAIA